jgi:hypothetical protein
VEKAPQKTSYRTFIPLFTKRPLKQKILTTTVMPGFGVFEDMEAFVASGGTVDSNGGMVYGGSWSSLQT